MKISRLSEALGAEVTDLDVTALDSATFAELRAAWNEHLVLVFRNQTLSIDGQIEFARLFGELGELPRATPDSSPRERYIMDITNIQLEDAKSYLPDGEMYFHFDTCYLERPYSACILYGLEVPTQGGETLFGNMVKAYEELPQDIKETIAGKSAVNAYDYDDVKNDRREPKEGSPRYEHPIVVTHPETGKQNLFVSRLMTFGIEDGLLNRLFDHAESSRFVYSHQWRKHDLVVWDNRCANHARTDFDPKERRHLRRISVTGTKPVAA